MAAYMRSSVTAMARPFSDYSGPRKFTDKELEDVESNSTNPEGEPEQFLAEWKRFKINHVTKTTESKLFYLVKYVDYDPIDSTWENAEMFRGEGQFLIDQWELTKEAIAAGQAEPFDVARYREDRKAIDIATKARRSKRAEKKRIRQWLETTPVANPAAIDTPPESVGEPAGLDSPTKLFGETSGIDLPSRPAAEPAATNSDPESVNQQPSVDASHVDDAGGSVTEEPLPKAVANSEARGAALEPLSEPAVSNDNVQPDLLFQTDIKTEPPDEDQIIARPVEAVNRPRVGVFLPHADPLSDAALSNVIIVPDDSSNDPKSDSSDDEPLSRRRRISDSDEEPLAQRRRRHVPSGAAFESSAVENAASSSSSSSSSSPSSAAPKTVNGGQSVSKKRPLSISPQTANAGRLKKRVAVRKDAQSSPRDDGQAGRVASANASSPTESDFESGEVTPSSRGENSGQQSGYTEPMPMILPVDSDRAARTPQTDIFASWQNPKTQRKSWLNSMKGDQVHYNSHNQSTILKRSQAKHAYIPPHPLDDLHISTSAPAGDSPLPQTNPSPSVIAAASRDLQANSRLNLHSPTSIMSPQELRHTSGQTAFERRKDIRLLSLPSTPTVPTTSVGASPFLTRRSSGQVAITKPEGGQLLACWFWINGRSCTNCPLEHRDGFEVAPEGNDLEKDQVCCIHEFERGGCNRTPAICWAMHEPRPYYAKLQPGGRPTKSKFHELHLQDTTRQPQDTTIQHQETTRQPQDSTRQPQDSTRQPQDSTRPPTRPLHDTLRLLPEEGLGCWYFNSTGFCKKTAEECFFLHEKTRWVAAKGGAHTSPIFRSDGGIYNRYTGKPMDDPRLAEDESLFIPEGEVMSMDAPSVTSISQVQQSTAAEGPHDAWKITTNLSIKQVMGSKISCEDCQLHFDREEHFQKALSLLGPSKISMQCETTCMTSDIQQWTRHYSAEDKLVGIIKDAPTSLLSVQETLRAYDLVAIFRLGNHTMFLNAIRGSSIDGQPPNFAIEFCLCLELQNAPMRMPVGRGPDLTVITQALGLEHDVHRPQAAYVAISRGSLEQKIDLIALLQTHGVKTYDNSTAGSWTYFTEHHTEGCVIFDSDFRAWRAVADLSKLLATPVRIFQLSPENNLELRPTRLFTRGVAVCLMEDCLVDFAEETLPALRQLHARANKSPTPLILFGRPGFLGWLASLITERKKSAQDHSALDEIEKILLDIHSTSPVRESNRSDEAVFDSRVQFVTPPAEDMPEYASFHATDEFQASTNLVDWFSSWCQSRVALLRRFVVLSMGKREWRDTWHANHGHIACLKPIEFANLEKTYSNRRLALERKETATSPPGSG